MSRRSRAMIVALGFLLGGSAARADEPKPVPKDVAEVAGVWESDWGLVTLKAAHAKDKKGIVVTGYYVQGRDHTSIIKSGTFHPVTRVLEFNLEEPWNNETKGTAKLTLGAEGKEFKGHFSKINKDQEKDEGMLHLTRVRPGEWKPDDLAGKWDTPWGIVTLKSATEKDKEAHPGIDYTGTYISVTGRDHKGTLSGSLNQLTGIFEITLEEPWWGDDTHGTATLTLGPKYGRLQGTYLKVNKNNGRDEGTVSWLRLHGDTFASYMDTIAADAGITHETPGFAFAAIHHGKVVFEKSYGMAIIKEKKPITMNTTFEIASCTKQFAGTAILLLQEQGKLSVTDDIRKYLPAMPEYDKKNPIRILHLARHTSGLPDYMSFENVKGKDPKFLCNNDYIPEFAKQRDKFPLRFPTGSQSRYENTNYMLMASIVERVSKKSFGEFLRSEIFDPLGMKTATVFESPRVQVKEPALGYHKEKNKWEDGWGPTPFRHETLLAVGDGAVWASIEDLSRWDIGWRDGKVLKPETIKKWLVPSTYGDKQENGYAFGWILDYDDGKLKGMMHVGGWGGFFSFVGRSVTEDLTFLGLANGISFDMDGAMRLFKATHPQGK